MILFYITVWPLTQRLCSLNRCADITSPSQTVDKYSDIDGTFFIEGT